MKESYFQSEIGMSIKHLLPDVHYVKIPDSPILPGGSGFKYRPIYKPYDCYFVHQKTFVAIECKQHRKDTGWAFKSVNERQEEALRDVVRAGGQSYIFVNFRIKEKSINEVIVLPLYQFVGIRDGFARKSIRLNELDNFIHIPRIKLSTEKYGWDMRLIV